MSINSKTKSGANIFSLYEYRAYTDRNIFNIIETINNDSDKFDKEAFDSLVDEIVKIYKSKVLFCSDKLRSVKYISYIKSVDKFNKINKDLCNSVAKKLGLDAIDICLYDNAKADVRDAYITDNNNFELILDEQYFNKPILFIDLFCSTGYLIDEIYKNINYEYCYFITLGIRFDSLNINNTKIVEYINNNDNFVESSNNKNDVDTIIIKKLFGKKDVKIEMNSINNSSDASSNISIYIGDNGDGKSTSLKISQIVSDDNVESYYKLSKYKFEKIIIRKKSNKEDIVIDFNSLIPRKKKFIKYLSNEKDKKIYERIINRFYLEEDSKILLDDVYKKNFLCFLNQITEEEFKNLFIKIRQDDNTYKKDLSRLAFKYNFVNYIVKDKKVKPSTEYDLFSIDEEIEFEPDEKHISLNMIIEYFLAFNNSLFLKFDDNFIEKKESTYVNVTSNRNIKPTLSKEKEFVDFELDDNRFLKDFDDELADLYGYYESYEPLYDEDDIEAEVWERYAEEREYYDDPYILDEDDEYDSNNPNYYDDEHDDINDFDSDYWLDNYDPSSELDRLDEIRKEVEAEYGYDDEDYYDDYSAEYYEQLEKEKRLSRANDTLKIFNDRCNYFLIFFDHIFIKSQNKVSLFKSYDEFKESYSKEINDEFLIGSRLSIKIKRFKDNNLYDSNFAFPIVNLESIINSYFLQNNIRSPFYSYREDDFIHPEKYIKEGNDTTSFILEKMLDETVRNNRYLIDYYFSKSDFSLDDFLITGVGKDRTHFITTFINDIENLKFFSEEKILLKLEKTINKYFIDKKIIFVNKSLFGYDMENRFIPLNYLSAGEKNLILILTQCALSKKKRLIFDEPDLSMSIEWQEHLILDMKSLFKGELIIATQSPQLVKNSSLHKYIKTINITDKDGEFYEHK